MTIQKVWRGRTETAQTRQRLREQLEGERRVAQKARGLVGFLRICDGADFVMNRKMMVDWVTDASAVSDGMSKPCKRCANPTDGRPNFLSLVIDALEPSGLLVGVLCVYILRYVADEPQ